MIHKALVKCQTGENVHPLTLFWMLVQHERKWTMEWRIALKQSKLVWLVTSLQVTVHGPTIDVPLDPGGWVCVSLWQRESIHMCHILWSTTKWSLGEINELHETLGSNFIAPTNYIARSKISEYIHISWFWVQIICHQVHREQRKKQGERKKVKDALCGVIYWYGVS